jgi:hypothetical protein
MGANKMPAVQKPADEHSCCKTKHSPNDKEKKHDCGACLMVCCRIVTAPADPITTSIDESPVAVRILLPPLLADDLGEPQSIFHPPRA